MAKPDKTEPALTSLHGDLGTPRAAQAALTEPETRKEPPIVPLVKPRDTEHEPDSERPARRRPTVDELANDAMLNHLSPAEFERLAASFMKRAGRAGKAPTGKHITVGGIMLVRDGKSVRVPHGTPVRLSDEEAAHFLAHGAVEPELS